MEGELDLGSIADWQMNANASIYDGTAKHNITKIWGHSHNDEMHGKDAFVSRLTVRV